MSAVSMNVTPRSSARLMVAIDSSQSVGPYHSLIPMQPSPCADTVRSPSLVVRMLMVMRKSLCIRAHSNANAVSAGEGDRDVAEAERGQHAVEHALRVLLRLGEQRALLSCGLDLLLGDLVHLLLAVRVAREEVADPVEQALLLGVHVRLVHVELSRLQLGLGERNRHGRPVLGHLEVLALQSGEVDVGDAGALTDEQGLAAGQG